MSIGGGIEVGGNINTLGGVAITSPTDGQILIYVAATQTWVNANNTPGAASLAGLTDVTLTAPVANDFLVYNGVKWVNLGGASARTAIGLAIGSNVQAWSASLDALTALNSTGLIAQTGANTFVDRTITGTAGTITVTNGAGVAGNPTITIDATYVGQTSITTLGTIATGTWNGTAVDIAHGGTGQATKTAAFDALSPLTTKGDLIVFDGTHNIRVGVGSDGQVLQANSGAAAGVSWVTNPAGAYDTVDNAGVPLTQRQVLNFSGTGIAATDNAGASRTDVALTGTVLDIAGLTPTANTIVYGNGTHLVNGSTLTTNTYYVSKNGNDATGDGSINFPFLTVSAAMTAIGSAANSVAFNDATKEYYVVNIGPGTYTEAVTIPNRPYILINFYGSQIVGNVTQAFDGTLFGGVLTTAKVIFQGHDIISLHTGLSAPKNGIVGNVTLNRTAGPFNFNAYEFLNTGVNGNIIADGAVAYTLLLFVSESNVSGNVTANQATININLYAENCNTPGTTGIGGTATPGTVTLRNLRNVTFAGSVVTGVATAGFNWDNVSFAGGGNFTGLTSAITTDSASYQNYLTNVATKGSETFTFRDSAKGINSQYVPTNYTATTTQVTGALTGIDNALGAIKGITQQQTVYVSRNGSDVTGNGSIQYPYATIFKANSVITTATNTQKFVVVLLGGRFDEAQNILLKPYVSYVGFGSSMTYITSPNNQIQPDPSFNNANGRTALVNLYVGGATGINFDLTAQGTTGSCVLDLVSTQINGGITYKGRNLGADFIQTEGGTYALGNWQLSNCQIQIVGGFAGGTLTVDTAGSTGGTQGSIINFGVGGAISIASTAGISNTLEMQNCSISTNTMAVSGATTTFSVDSSSLPTLASNFTVSGGATVNKYTSAYGINAGYTPSHYTATSTDIVGNLQGIDNALAAFEGVFPWTSVAGTSQTLVKNNGYFAANAALTTFTLPATANVGDTFKISADGAGLFTVAQNAGQSIRFAIDVTTVGVGGSITATAQGDTLEIVCKVANTGFQVVGSVGNFNVV